MTAEGHKVVSLHGQMTSEERDDVMTRYRKGEFKVDSISRGFYAGADQVYRYSVR